MTSGRKLSKILWAILIANLLFNSLYFAWLKTINSDTVASALLLEELFKSRVYIPTQNILPTLFYHPPLSIIFGWDSYRLATIVIFKLLFLFGGYLYFYRKFWEDLPKRNSWIFLPPLFLLVNQSALFYDLLTDITHRIFLLGLTFLILPIISSRLPFKFNLVSGCIFTLILSLILFSDAYFLFVFALPLLVSSLLIGSTAKKPKDYLILAGFIYLSLTISLVVIFLLNLTPWFYFSGISTQIAGASHILSNANAYFKGLFQLLNVSSGGQLSALKETLSLANLSLLLTGLVGLFWSLKEGVKEKNIFLIWLPLSFLVLTSSFLLSSYTLSIENVRYLMIFPFLLTFGLLFIIKKTLRIYPKGAVFFGIYILAVSLLNFSQFNVLAKKPTFEEKYQTNLETLKVLSRENLSYGYSGFWHSGINTYFSQNKIKVRQITCYNQRIVPYLHLSSQRWYDPEIFNGSTFLLIDYQGYEAPHFKDCPPQKIIEQFGLPVKEMTIKAGGEDLTLMIFDYNISRRF